MFACGGVTVMFEKINVIKFNNVDHTYSIGSPFEYNALSDASVEIKQGEFVAIIGHTGSGKSTLVQHINGLLKPTNGTLEVVGHKITGEKKQKSLLKIREKAGLVFQFPEAQLFEETVKKDIEFGPKNFGVDVTTRDKKSREAIRLVGLDDSYLERSPFELSGGQKRRVAIAGILAMDPEILILDEPTAGLDPVGKQEILELIKTLNNQGKTIILVTHDMNDVLAYASRVIVMNESRIIEDATPDIIFSYKGLLQNMQIDLPDISALIHKLNSQGYNIPFTVKTIPELVKKIKEGN